MQLIKPPLFVLIFILHVSLIYARTRICSHRLNKAIKTLCTFRDEKSHCLYGAYFNLHSIGDNDTNNTTSGE